MPWGEIIIIWIGLSFVAGIGIARGFRNGLVNSSRAPLPRLRHHYRYGFVDTYEGFGASALRAPGSRKSSPASRLSPASPLRSHDAGLALDTSFHSSGE